mmetsp:Transcript_24761/g.72516  ORF Transcript_24761/g.72516 Transcript_24761/m.72516 type:complete len:229 (-) Transcript_24761:1061-1747(-)
MDPPMELQTSCRPGVGTECDDRHVRTVRRYETGEEGSVVASMAVSSSIGQDEYRRRVPFRGGRDGRLGRGGDGSPCLVDSRPPVLPNLLPSVPQWTNQIRTSRSELFRTVNDLVHHTYRFDGIFPLGRFPAQHDRVGAVVHGVGHVGHLGPSRTRILSHRFEHLRRDDDRFPGGIARGHHLLLGIDHLLDGYLHAEISSRDHDAIRFVQYRIEVTQCGHRFDLGDDEG